MDKKSIFNQVKSSIDIISTVQNLLPSGRKENNEYVALNPTRADEHLGSFRINLTNGQWIDHATADKGGDITSLVAYLKGISQYEAAQYLLENRRCSKRWNLKYSSPKVAKEPKVQVKKKFREHKIIDPEIYKKILNHLRIKYPNCFTRPMKPLAIGIHKELLGECEELGISGVQLKSFCKAYCKNSKYRELIMVGAERVNLQGEVVSLVVEQEVRKPIAKPVEKEAN